MAIQDIDNRDYRGKKPNFERDRFNTISEMKLFPETDIDEGHISMCIEDGNHYKYKSSNEFDPLTGRWRKFPNTNNSTDGTDPNEFATKLELEEVRSSIPDTDTELSDTSKNPVENRVVNAALRLASDGVDANREAIVTLQNKVNALTGIDSTFAGYYAGSGDLPSVSSPCWALVGDLSAARPFAYYTGSGGGGEIQQEVSATIEAGTWSENNGSRCSDEASPTSVGKRLRSDDAIFIVKGSKYKISVNSGYQVFVIFFSNFVTNALGDYSNTVAKYLAWQQTIEFTAEYNYMAIILRKEDNSSISTSDSHGLSIITTTTTTAGWVDLSNRLGTYDFASFEQPTLVLPTVMASTYDTEDNLVNGTIRIIDNQLVIHKGSAFYLYVHDVMAKDSTKVYYYVNNSGKDIVIDMALGDTVCIDLSESQAYPAATSLSVGSSIKVLRYGDFNAMQVPVCNMRTAHVTVNPQFLWMLYYDRISGANRNDMGLIGNNSTAYLRNGVIHVSKRSYLYVYRDTGRLKATYLRLNAVNGFDYDLKGLEFRTLVIDGSKIVWMDDSSTVNDLDDIVKVVVGREYSANDIPVAHVRSGKIFVYPAFQAIFGYIDLKGGVESVSAMNRSDFLPAYYSVCRAKRDTLTMGASWKSRCNILHISDNHATNEDGYVNVLEAVILAGCNNMNLNAVVNTGDLSNGFGVGVSKNTVKTTLNRIRDMMLEFNIPAMALLGNHDANDYGGDPSYALTKKEQWDSIFDGLFPKWRSVIFGSTTYLQPSEMDKTIEAGTWRETIGCRSSDEASPTYKGLRLRTDNILPLTAGYRYTVTVKEGFEAYIIVFSEFLSNEIDYTGNTVKYYDGWDQTFDIIANGDEVGMAIVIRKRQNEPITTGDDHGLSVQGYAANISPASNNYRHNSYCDLTGDDFGRIRIIMLDQLDHSLQTDGSGKLVYTCQNDPVYSQAQIDWLCNTALQVPDGTGVIICNHYPFDKTPSSDPNESLVVDGDYVQPWNMIPDIVQAWQDKTALNRMYNDRMGLQNITVNVDFSNIGSGCEFICYLCGHTHYKTNKVVTGYKQMMLLEDSSGSYGTIYSDLVRLAGTPTSNAFSILSVDRTQGVIYRTSYGAYKGVDETEKSRIEKINYRV